MNNEFILGQAEYIPDELLYNFISKSLPGIKVVQMKLPVSVDENGTEMYVAVSHLVGKESDGETEIANGCLEFLAKEINKTGHKKVGIYKLLKNPKVELYKSPSIILRCAFPQPMGIKDVEDEYVPRFTKDIKPFEYNQGDILKNKGGE